MAIDRAAGLPDAITINPEVRRVNKNGDKSCVLYRWRKVLFVSPFERKSGNIREDEISSIESL